MFLWRRQTQDHQDDDMHRDAKVRELKDALGPLSGRSLQFCTDACLRRYLVARNWNHEIAHEGETGKASRAGFRDRLGRTVLIMRPGMQNTTVGEENIRHLVYLLENAILNLSEGQEQMSWLIDFTGWTISTNISIKTSRDIVHILQNHYPERLALAFLYNPPRIFEAFWKVVKYFLDPKTFEKVKFVYPNKKESAELMSSYFDVENLPSEFGGKATLKYDHEEFSRMMLQEEVKTASYWGFEYKPCHLNNGYSGPEKVPEPIALAPPAS
ncbi:CRAL-TRIO lipid binding domain [Dillenia turbinata]|uniref:CRAL-TRIO lipid binding domain n=1 Tax=Dillenia turbinata TaxID=194707 RepID=A0AAN8UVD6_9MAGN